MKLSVIIPVLDSHEIVRRQWLYFRKAGVGLRNDVEVILVDDGSDTPIVLPEFAWGWGRILATGDKRPWTQPKARNVGAAKAAGDVLLFTDIDHIVPRESIEWALTCQYDYARFRREVAVLDEDGNLIQDRDKLAELGYPRDRGLRVSCHTLSMVIRADVFRATGGFREKVGKHPTHDDGNMKRQLNKLGARKCPDKDPDERPLVYLIPNGRFCGDGTDHNADPLNLFHGAKR